jgi:hypothetical protein
MPLYGVSSGGGGGTTTQVEVSRPRPLHEYNSGSLGATNGNFSTTQRVGMVYNEAQITATSLTIYASTLTTAGTFRITLYTENGQTKVLDLTTPTISSSNQLVTMTFTATVIAAGNYYISLVPVSTASCLFSGFNTLTTTGSTALNKDIGFQPVAEGTLDISGTPGVPLATFSPSGSISPINSATLMFRLDT